MRSKSPFSLVVSYVLTSGRMATIKHVRGEEIASIDSKFEPVCSIYLAESSIPNAGMGVFTSKAIPKGAQISSTGDGPVIILHDRDIMSREAYLGFGHRNYLWDEETLDDHEGDVNSAAVPDTGALANYHPILWNIISSIGIDSFVYDDSILDRNIDLGAGAFSYHKSRNTTAYRDITAGEELLHDYGEEWLESPSRYKSFQDAARESNYVSAGNIVQRFRLDNLDDASISVVQEIVNIYDKRTASILPKSRLANESILKDTDESIAINLGKASVQQRSADWLIQNGRCMDNIVPRISTLPQAGNGAFAQRFLPEGSLVIPAPTLQTMDAKYLDIKNRDGSVKNSQMLLNYCIAHEDSTMLLCPITRAILINHCSERMDFGGKCGEGVDANAKLQFDSNFDAESKVWQQKSFNEIKEDVHAGRRGLSFDVIATRDIQPGEEVFIDYGDTWEEAWKEHLKSWQPPAKYSKYSRYTSVTKLTNDHDIRTTAELVKNPYADNVEVQCLFGARYTYKDDFALPPSNWKDMSDAAIIEKHSYPGGMHSINAKKPEQVGIEWIYNPCDIHFHGDDGHLTVGIYALSDDVPLIFTDYPSESVRFVSKEYTSDEHLPNSFRHPIGLADKTMFPEQWKNLKLNE